MNEYMNFIPNSTSSVISPLDYTTFLSPREYAMMLWDKQRTPFRNDSGYDYDLAGYWKEFGGFNPDGRSHLDDRYKKPNHPTFSTYSKYYNGQPHAINWEELPLWRLLSERGVL